MYVNKSKRAPFYIFRHYATFFERKKSKISSFFQKNVLRFLSLRYSADFRRSHLVLKDQSRAGYQTTEKDKYQIVLAQYNAWPWF